MPKRMSNVCWDVAFDISKATIDQRIRNCTSHFGWQHAVRLIIDRKIPFNSLKIAEVGCGTGTTSLTFGLLGASVTLIDYNRKVLGTARDIYKLYDYRPKLIYADCMEAPVRALAGKFDFVISSGLAEHFIGIDREQCIRYHRLLLKEGGIAYIGVPNKLSPFYQGIKEFRKLTGTWNLEIEVPFTKQELKIVAGKAGFKAAHVIGNAPLKKDLVDYSRGFGSAVKALFPSSIQERLRARKEKERETVRSDIADDIRQHCQNIVTAIKRNDVKRPHSSIVNTFSAGLILFAFN